MKKIDWSKIQKNPIPKLTMDRKSGEMKEMSTFKEAMAKAYAQEADLEKAEKRLNELFPAMQKLLLIRFTNHTPIKVIKPISYSSHALYKGERTAEFVDVKAIIAPGTELIFKSSNKSLMHFTFTDKNDPDKEYEIYWSDHKQLLTCTDIFDVVNNLYK